MGRMQDPPQRDDAQPHTSPVFVLSCPRSGSTLLRYILDTHPAIWSPGELALGRLIKAHRFTLTRVHAIAAGLDAEKTCQREVRTLITGLMTRETAARGKSVWCDKTPENLSFLPEIAWTFPDARFLCLYRKSLDVVHSSLEASRWGFMEELAPSAARAPQNLVEAMLENWAAMTSRMLALEASGARCFRIYYEGLVNAPESTMNQVCAFLGLPWDDGILARVFAQPHEAGGGDYEIRRLSSIDGSRIGRGAEIPLAVLARVSPGVAGRCADLHLELGYPC